MQKFLVRSIAANMFRDLEDCAITCGKTVPIEEIVGIDFDECTITNPYLAGWLLDKGVNACVASNETEVHAKGPGDVFYAILDKNYKYIHPTDLEYFLDKDFDVIVRKHEIIAIP